MFRTCLPWERSGFWTLYFSLPECPPHPQPDSGFCDPVLCREQPIPARPSRTLAADPCAPVTDSSSVPGQRCCKLRCAAQAHSSRHRIALLLGRHPSAAAVLCRSEGAHAPEAASCLAAAAKLLRRADQGSGSSARALLPRHTEPASHALVRRRRKDMGAYSRVCPDLANPGRAEFGR